MDRTPWPANDGPERLASPWPNTTGPTVYEPTTDDEVPEDWHVPQRNKRLALWLYKRGWTFDDFYWPAVRTLSTWTEEPDYDHGIDWTLCFDPSEWLIGWSRPQDLEAIHDERWKDVVIHLGPFSIICHEWWLRAKHR